jgi:hypothetical protein
MTTKLSEQFHHSIELTTLISKEWWTDRVVISIELWNCSDSVVISIEWWNCSDSFVVIYVFHFNT